MQQQRPFWNPSNALLAAALLIPVLIFYGIVWWKFVPLPVEDDYSSMLAFALKWNALPDWPHRLLLVFTNQHNEYKMPLTFGLQSIELAFTHRIHVGAWMWAGNLMALAMLVPLWMDCMPQQPVRRRLVAFVPVAWLLMNLGYAEALNFTLTGFQALSALTWSLGCILMLSRASWKWNVLAIPMALLACGTNANALLLAPVGFVMLLRRRSWVIVAWCAAFVLEVAMYFYRYTQIPHPVPTFVAAARYFLGTAGSSFGYHTHTVPAILAGMLLLLLFAFLVRHGSPRLAPFAFWASVWLLLSFAMITYGRAGVDPDSFLVSRYKVNCDLFMALLFLQALHLCDVGRLPLPRFCGFVPVVAVVLVAFLTYSDALGLYRLFRRERDVRYGMTRYVESHGAISPMTYPPPLEPWMDRPGIMENARVILNTAAAQGLYRVPSKF